jgi:hypothetical protein
VRCFLFVFINWAIRAISVISKLTLPLVLILCSCVRAPQTPPENGNPKTMPHPARGPSSEFDKKRATSGSHADLDTFVEELRNACPHLVKRKTIVPLPVELLNDFPEGMRWGYPKVTLRSWFHGRNDIEGAIRFSRADECQVVRLKKVGSKIEALLISPVPDEPQRRDLFKLEVEPQLLNYAYEADSERHVGTRWLKAEGWACGCGTAPNNLGLLTEVNGEVAIYGGRAAAVKAYCEPETYSCDCSTVRVTAEPTADSLLPNLPPRCKVPPSVEDALRHLPQEPWFVLEQENTPVLYKTMNACKRSVSTP